MAEAPEGVERLMREVEQEQATEDDRVTVAFETMAPLLVEQERVSQYLVTKGTPELRQVLLNLASSEEAAEIADREYLLTPEQRARLKSLLSKESGES